MNVVSAREARVRGVLPCFDRIERLPRPSHAVAPNGHFTGLPDFALLLERGQRRRAVHVPYQHVVQLFLECREAGRFRIARTWQLDGHCRRG